MVRQLLFAVIVTMVICTSVFAQQPKNSDSGMNDVQILSEAAYKQCLIEREERITKTQKENAEALPIIKSLFSESFCSCAAEGIKHDITPGTVNSLGATGIRQRMIPIYQRCAAVGFRNELPAMCKAWYGGLFPPSERMTEQQQSAACGCMQEAGNTIQPEDLPEVAKQTLQDYQEWRANPALRFTAARPKSILGVLAQCARAEGLRK